MAKSIQVSSQSSYPLDYHFSGRRAAMRPLFDMIIAELGQELDFELKIGKAYVGLLHRLVFAALHIQTKKIIVEFTLRRPLTSPRIVKAKQFQNSRWAYYVELANPAALDAELRGWIREAYE